MFDRSLLHHRHRVFLYPIWSSCCRRRYREGLPASVQRITLTNKTSPNQVNTLLNGIGSLYLSGIPVQLSSLYGKPAYPVPRGTPMISPTVKWDHSIQYQVPSFLPQNNSGQNDFEISLKNDDDKSLAGHKINGRVLYPAAGYMVNHLIHYNAAIDTLNTSGVRIQGMTVTPTSKRKTQLADPTYEIFEYHKFFTTPQDTQLMINNGSILEILLDLALENIRPDHVQMLDLAENLNLSLDIKNIIDQKPRKTVRNNRLMKLGSLAQYFTIESSQLIQNRPDIKNIIDQKPRKTVRNNRLMKLGSLAQYFINA
ncbi:uncharacterized protein LOC103506739 [Diaphorina citri]|uniref:Uncharacterized protein LOC103506739 n=1 Tax=Diaphorina citri TaxID=121845 RepID=A0A1S3CY23_DIACI|nr:uncharacterized protein LOC103506739 [Diaphorina citri]